MTFRKIQPSSGIDNQFLTRPNDKSLGYWHRPSGTAASLKPLPTIKTSIFLSRWVQSDPKDNIYEYHCAADDAARQQRL